VTHPDDLLPGMEQNLAEHACHLTALPGMDVSQAADLLIPTAAWTTNSYNVIAAARFTRPRRRPEIEETAQRIRRDRAALLLVPAGASYPWTWPARWPRRAFRRPEDEAAMWLRWTTRRRAGDGVPANPAELAIRHVTTPAELDGLRGRYLKPRNWDPPAATVREFYARTARSSRLPRAARPVTWSATVTDGRPARRRRSRTLAWPGCTTSARWRPGGAAATARGDRRGAARGARRWARGGGCCRPASWGSRCTTAGVPRLRPRHRGIRLPGLTGAATTGAALRRAGRLVSGNDRLRAGTWRGAGLSPFPVSDVEEPGCAAQRTWWPFRKSPANVFAMDDITRRGGDDQPELAVAVQRGVGEVLRPDETPCRAGCRCRLDDFAWM